MLHFKKDQKPKRAVIDSSVLQPSIKRKQLNRHDDATDRQVLVLTNSQTRCYKGKVC